MYHNLYLNILSTDLKKLTQNISQHIFYESLYIFNEDTYEQPNSLKFILNTYWVYFKQSINYDN